jgi:hypothetical protein
MIVIACADFERLQGSRRMTSEPVTTPAEVDQLPHLGACCRKNLHRQAIIGESHPLTFRAPDQAPTATHANTPECPRVKVFDNGLNGDITPLKRDFSGLPGKKLWSIRAATNSDRYECASENIKVQPYRPVSNVVGVVLLLQIHSPITSDHHLPHSTQPWTDRSS